MTRRSRSPRPQQQPREQAAIDPRLKTLGAHLRATRKEVFREGHIAFSRRMGVAVATLRKMERGNPNVRIGLWIKALTLMQVDDAVFEASRPALLLLTSYSEQADRAFEASVRNQPPPSGPSAE